jgi:curved DNA-binding protein CbpA
MIPDYYAILGISPTADFEALRQAFRKKAQMHHPDRGGSHAEMVKINEAWNILSNHETRAEYDRVRHSSQISPTFADTASRARREAEVYPQNWDAFDSWLNRMGKDFSATKFIPKDYYFPVANTASGWAFVIAGGMLGVLACKFFLWDRNVKHGSLFLGLFIFCAWGAAWVHKLVTFLFFSSPAVASSSLSSSSTAASRATPPSRPKYKAAAEAHLTAKVLLGCPTCNQQLRVPAVNQKIRITCARCGEIFIHNP